jgi:hypothetical protein
MAYPSELIMAYTYPPGFYRARHGCSFLQRFSLFPPHDLYKIGILFVGSGCILVVVVIRTDHGVFVDPYG